MENTKWSLAEIAYGQSGLLWIFKGYPGNKADMTDEAYRTCYAVNTTSLVVTQHPCEAKLHGLCVVANSGCTGDEELYFDGYCYKTLGRNEYATADAEAECVKQGSHLASVHTEEENHAIRILIGDRYPFGKCVRLGMTYKVDNGYKHTVGSTFDGTPFDYGDRQCDTGSGYPWCNNQPDCYGTLGNGGGGGWRATTVVMYSEFHGGRKCWDDLDDSKCSAVCKRKLQ
ncbi:hypothetical protein AAVH_09086 [Aphelenchoides avenae]|nr:hypothetical protein AAVH_09086 [Aphelenchus avenae]